MGRPAASTVESMRATSPLERPGAERPTTARRRWSRSPQPRVDTLHIGPPVLPVLQGGGGAVERRMLELAREQTRRRGSSLILSVAPRTGDAPPAGAAPSPLVVYLDAPRDRPGADLAYLRAINRITRTVRPRRVHVHGYVFAALALPPGIPALLTVDFHRYARGSSAARPLLRRLLERYDVICPVSDFCRRQFDEYWGSAGGERAVVANGVLLEQFHPLGGAARDAARARLGVGPGDTLFVYCGRLTPQKGTDVLIEGWRRAGLVDDPSTHLVIAGPVAEQFGGRDVHRLADALPGSGIRHLGLLGEAGLAQLMGAADVFVMPTVADEMFGMAVVEAMACGAVPIVTDCGALPEVTAGVGRVVRAGDPSALADALRQAAGGIPADQRRAAVERAGRFAWSHVAEDFERVYEELER